MKLSTKTRYGMRVMIDLALLQQSDQPIHLNEIAKRQDLSDKYLEQIISILKSNNFVVSIRGAKGGYFLSRPASEINAKDIVESLEGKLNLVDCLGDISCEITGHCATQKLWNLMSNSLKDLLKNLTLEELVKWQKEANNSLDYII
jgi:Rrf2 family transcriptional regulator, cysteine metabolism repressor